MPTKVNTRQKSLTVLMVIKYLMLMYGARVGQIDTSTISGLDQKLFAEVVSKRISFQKLRETFPKFSMLVKSRQVQEYPGFAGQIYFVIDLIQWNMLLCKTLWIPSDRTKIVDMIGQKLNLVMDEYSVDEIENSLNHTVSEIYKMVQMLEGSLSRRSQKWVDDYALFYKMWVHINDLIEEVKDAI